MIKKTITTEDLFNEGEKITKDYYFHLTTSDLIEMEISTKGGLEQMLQDAVASEDGHAIVEMIKTFIGRSVGEKKGSEFVKTQEYTDAFLSSEAYSTLLLDLATDAEGSAAFINGITPKNLEADMNKIGKNAKKAKKQTGAGGFAQKP